MQSEHVLRILERLRGGKEGRRGRDLVHFRKCSEVGDKFIGAESLIQFLMMLWGKSGGGRGRAEIDLRSSIALV